MDCFRQGDHLLLRLVETDVGNKQQSSSGSSNVLAVPRVYICFDEGRWAYDHGAEVSPFTPSRNDRRQYRRNGLDWGWTWKDALKTRIARHHEICGSSAFWLEGGYL